MSRVALSKTKLILSILIAAVLIAGGSTWAVWHYRQAAAAKTAAHTQTQLTTISYSGQTGVDALTLLKRHAQVTVKHYSFGDMVTGIDGVAGNGPKYWTFYINGQEASVGAGAYVTKNSDTLSWKLQ